MAAASLLRSAPDLLVQYARYHRDRRNIATHLVGVPLIVFAVCVLLSRPSIGPAVAGVAPTPALLLWAASTAWYLSRGAVLPGLAVSLANGVLTALATLAVQAGAGPGLGLGCFVVGWIIQFVGHYYEGRKPAFADDLVGLLVGPLFVAAEVLFSLGLCRRLSLQIEREAGPTHLRDLASPVT